MKGGRERNGSSQMIYPVVSPQSGQTHTLKLSYTEPTTNRVLYGNRTYRGNIDNLSLTVKKIIQLNNFSATLVLISFQTYWDGYPV